MTTDYDAAKREDAGEGISFTFADREWTTVPLISAGAVFDLADAVGEDDLGAQIRGYRTFMLAVMPEETHDEILAALRVVTIGEALDAAKRIVNEATARPFTPPSPSAT